MASQFDLQNLDGTPLSKINIGEMAVGETSAEKDVRVYSSGDGVPSFLELGILLSTRTESEGENEEGLEVYTEGWVETNYSGSWELIKQGPNGTVVPLADPGIGNSIDFKLRIVIPANAQSTGDIIVSIELFYD